MEREDSVEIDHLAELAHEDEEAEDKQQPNLSTESKPGRTEGDREGDQENSSSGEGGIDNW